MRFLEKRSETSSFLYLSLVPSLPQLGSPDVCECARKRDVPSRARDIAHIVSPRVSLHRSACGELHLLSTSR